MCLSVVVAGYRIGEATHVSVYMYLMKGPHDDKLEESGYWPMRGTFTIELFHQLNDSNHHSYMVYYTCSGFYRVTMDKSIEIGFLPLFISRDTLFQHNGYLKNDILILESPTQLTVMAAKGTSKVYSYITVCW